MNASDLTFGIEIETTLPAGTLPVGGYFTGADVAGLPGWKAKTDASIRGSRGRVGCEFVSPVLRGAEGIRAVLHALTVIRGLGARVNASCGFHVHVGFDASNRAGLKRLVTLVANFEKAIFAATGTKGRERGAYCRGLAQHGDSDAAQQRAGIVRYHVLNLTNLTTNRRPTVEFRAFGGTLNPVKVVGYIKLCLGLVERALKAKRVTNFTAPPTSETSPIKRGGEGTTALNRLFYQLGWTKGRTDHTYGDVGPVGPAWKTIKNELIRLAQAYDSQR